MSNHTKTCTGGTAEAPCGLLCDECLIHRDIIAKVEHVIPDDDYTELLAGVFKILGDPTRLKILLCLLRSEMCVCDLGELLQKEQSAVSHQLRLLRAMQLVNAERRGKSIFYSIADKRLARILKTALISAPSSPTQ